MSTSDADLSVAEPAGLRQLHVNDSPAPVGHKLLGVHFERAADVRSWESMVGTRTSELKKARQTLTEQSDTIDVLRATSHVAAIDAELLLLEGVVA